MINPIVKQAVREALLGIALALMIGTGIIGLFQAMGEQADINAKAAQQHLETGR